MSIFNTTLFKVALGGGVFVVVTCKWMENRLTTGFRQQEWYQASMKMLHMYKPAEDFLGAPIFGGRVNLYGRRDLMVVDCEAKAAIPVTGPKAKGILYVFATRENTDKSWDIDRLDLEIKDTNQRWKFYERNPSSSTPSVENDKDKKEVLSYVGL